MAKTLIALFVCAFFAIVLAQEPAKPEWPKSFSATVAMSNWERRGDSWGRWFYSERLQKDRFDGNAWFREEPYFANRIFDHKVEKEISAFFQFGTVFCYVHDINGTLPHPEFKRVIYQGKAIIDYEPVYHWVETSPDNQLVISYYDTQDTRLPKRLDVDDRARQHSFRILFHEFDKSPQDDALFSLPGPIAEQCNEFQF